MPRFRTAYIISQEYKRKKRRFRVILGIVCLFAILIFYSQIIDFIDRSEDISSVPSKPSNKDNFSVQNRSTDLDKSRSGSMKRSATTSKPSGGTLTKDLEIYYNRGVTYYESGDYDNAIVEFSKAIGINLRYSDAYYMRGNAYYKRGQYDQAISDYTKAIEINPGCDTAYNNRGLAYHMKGQYDQAISDYTKAIEINPKNAIPYYNRGFAYHMKGEYDRAISDYTRAIEINPSYAEAYNNRGLAYRIKGQFERAKEDFKRACDLGITQACEELKKLK